MSRPGAPAAGAVGATAAAGAASVFAYLARTAEAVPDGVRWRTLDYDDQPQYSLALGDGVAGVALFLADYARLTGDARARALAAAGVRWCASPARRAEAWWPSADNDGLAAGRAGVVPAALRLAAACGAADAPGRAAALAAARAAGDHVLQGAPGAPTAAGPGAADFLYGAAGTVLLLLGLWRATRAGRYLVGARRWGRWLAAAGVRDAAGLHWPRSPGHLAFDFCHGAAGVGYAFLGLAAAGRGAAEPWAGLAREVAATLRRHAVPDRGGLNWPPAAPPGAPPAPLKCQWCAGAPGVGLFWARGYEVLGDPAFLAAAGAAGETTAAWGDARGTAGQCHGLAGGAELFVELARLTGEARWRARAHAFARRMLRYRLTTPAGEAWLTDTAGCTSPDLLYGGAGAGHLFLRLRAPATVAWWGSERVTPPRTTASPARLGGASGGQE